METSIPEIYNGANSALTTLTNNSSYIENLYVLVAITSFFWIFIEFRGTQALIGSLRTHFITLVFIYLFFGGVVTSDVTVTLDHPDGTTSTGTYQMAPGFKWVTYVITSICGWAAGAIGTASMNSLNIDVSKMPFATEKYTLKSAKIEQLFAAAAKDPNFADKNNYYQNNCLDADKLKQNPPAMTFNIYNSAYIRDTPPPNPDCSSTGSWLFNSAYNTVQTIAQKNNMSTDDVARIGGKNWLQRQIDKVNPESLVIAAAEAVLSVFLRVVSIVTYATAWIYVMALPFFLGILTQMYVGVFPLIVAMAMLPGKWMSIVTYFEGYLWLAFMPVVIAAVDGFGMQLTSMLNDLLSLPATMVILAKISIVLSVPAITSFLLFGQRTYRVGPSNIAAPAAHSLVNTMKMAARRVGGPGPGRGPGGGRPDTGPAGRILDGGGDWRGGNVVASNGGRGQQPAGTPVVTAASNHAMKQNNAEAVGDLFAGLNGGFNGESHFSNSAVSGHIKVGGNGGELGGALDKISPEMKQMGVGLLVKDVAGKTASVNAQAYAGGGMRYSTPEGGNASDAAMADRLNNPGSGEMFAASIVSDGWKFRAKDGVKGVWVSKLSWGKELSTQFMEGEDLYKFAQYRERDL